MLTGSAGPRRRGFSGLKSKSATEPKNLPAWLHHSTAARRKLSLMSLSGILPPDNGQSFTRVMYAWEAGQSRKRKRFGRRITIAIGRRREYDSSSSAVWDPCFDPDGGG